MDVRKEIIRIRECGGILGNRYDMEDKQLVNS
jgi:hypothetical protein